MRESQGVRNLYARLTEIYDEQQIVLEPVIAGSVRPDLIVYRDTDQNQPYLVVEYKKSLSYRRGNKAFEQLDTYLRELDCDYGALVTPSVEYVFQWEPNIDIPERSLGGFPTTSHDQPPQRPIRTPEEARFLIDRILNSVGRIRGKELDVYEIYQTLLQKLVIDTSESGGSLPDTENIDRRLSTINRELREEYSAFEPVEYAEYEATAKATLSVFAGYDIENLPAEVTDAFCELEPAGSSKLSQHKTKPNVVRPIVRLADVEEGMSVLDPAAGWGNTIRAAVDEGGDGYAVEIMQSVVNSGLFLSAITNQHVQYTCGDFFELVENTSNDGSTATLSDFEDQSTDTEVDNESTLPGPGSYDRIILDPPVGKKLSAESAPFALDNDRTVRIEEAFISHSLELLNPGGILVAIVPETVLAGERTRELREYILSDYTIESIVTFEASIYSGSQAKAGLVKISNNRTPGSEQNIKISTIDELPDGKVETALNEAIDRIESGNHEWMTFDPGVDRTLLPKQVLGQSEIADEIYDEYGSAVPLEDVADEIIGGVSKPSAGDTQNNVDMVPYLSPIDLEDDEPNPPSVPVDAARVKAGQSDILVRVKGEPLVAHRPETTVVPSSDWAVVRFDSTEKASLYLDFFQSNFAEKAVEANRRGKIVPYITISALRDIPVPNLNVDEQGGDEA